MTETEKKALALVNAVCAEWEVSPATEDDMDGSACFAALTRAIEQHEAFRQEVSDAVKWFFAITMMPDTDCRTLSRFILPKPDPLVEAWDEAHEVGDGISKLETFRAAIEARGGRIVWEGE